MVKLEDKTDVAVAELDQRRTEHDGQHGIRDMYRSGVRPVEPAEQVQQCALADARRSDNRQHLAFRDLEIQIAKHVNTLAADNVGLVEGFDAYERHVKSQHPKPNTHSPNQGTNARLASHQMWNSGVGRCGLGVES